MLLKKIASKIDPVLAIVLPQCRMDKIEELLDRYAIENWRTCSAIFLIKIDDQYIRSSGHITAAVRRQSRDYGLDHKAGNIRYIVLKELEFDAKKIINWVGYENFVEVEHLKTLSNGLLNLKLKEWHLDWMSGVLSEISKWHYDTVGKNHIDDWLRQFDSISSGKYRWVGERLLRNFKVWSAEQIAEIFQSNYPEQAPQGEVCVIKYENGKSADSVAVLLRKVNSHLLSEAKVLHYVEYLESDSPIDCYVFEDGAFTGVEISDLLKSLAGIDGFSKCKPLKDLSILQNRRTFLHFALGTDVGLHRIKNTIAQLGIDVTVISGNEIGILTDSGKENMKNGLLYILDDDGKEVLRCSDSDIVPQAFLGDRWGDRKSDAINFCKKIGFELFRSYLKKKEKIWTDRRIRDCALGAGNMALIFAFSHSLPKSTLPVFWCHGVGIDVNQKEFPWLPLFPNAHKN